MENKRHSHWTIQTCSYSLTNKVHSDSCMVRQSYKAWNPLTDPRLIRRMRLLFYFYKRGSSSTRKRRSDSRGPIEWKRRETCWVSAKGRKSNWIVWKWGREWIQDFRFQESPWFKTRCKRRRVLCLLYRMPIHPCHPLRPLPKHLPLLNRQRQWLKMRPRLSPS